MHTVETISKAARGTVIETSILASTLATELADHGVDCAVIDLLTISQMGDAGFVEHLNGIRLSDQTLIVRGIMADLDAAKRARFNIEHTLTKFGGRAVLVA